MQVDASSTDDVQTKAMKHAMTVLDVVAIAAAAGLATINVPEVNLTPQWLTGSGGYGVPASRSGKPMAPVQRDAGADRQSPDRANGNRDGQRP